jgi:predicted nucleotidyltransferase
MTSEILEQLAAIEQQHDVRILYALESGSRAWGFASRNSDYEVRFIYSPVIVNVYIA